MLSYDFVRSLARDTTNEDLIRIYRENPNNRDLHLLIYTLACGRDRDNARNLAHQIAAKYGFRLPPVLKRVA